MLRVYAADFRPRDFDGHILLLLDDIDFHALRLSMRTPCPRSVTTLKMMPLVFHLSFQFSISLMKRRRSRAEEAEYAAPSASRARRRRDAHALAAGGGD